MLKPLKFMATIIARTLQRKQQLDAQFVEIVKKDSQIKFEGIFLKKN